jgi:hypothetical protein
MMFSPAGFELGYCLAGFFLTLKFEFMQKKITIGWGRMMRGLGGALESECRTIDTDARLISTFYDYNQLWHQVVLKARRKNRRCTLSYGGFKSYCRNWAEWRGSQGSTNPFTRFKDLL